MRAIRILLLIAPLLASCGPQQERGEGSPRFGRGRADTVAHVPSDLAALFGALDTTLSAADKDLLRTSTPDTPARYHFSLGMFIRNEFGLWSGGPLASYLNTLGLRHPDDMSGVLIDLYGENLRGEPIDIPGAIRRLPPAPSPEDFTVLPGADSLPQ